MTESKWLRSRQPKRMLLFVQRKASDRKLRLCMCGCVRADRQEPGGDETDRAIELGERMADGGSFEPEERVAILGAIRPLLEAPNGTRDHDTVLRLLNTHACVTDDPLHLLIYRIPWLDRLLALPVLPLLIANWLSESWNELPNAATWCPVIRCVFGNPFRSVTFSPEWRTDTVLGLAQQMYAAREFGAMPILGDALQDANCSDHAILDHCRKPGTHARGCWVVDLVLGKE